MRFLVSCSVLLTSAIFFFSCHTEADKHTVDSHQPDSTLNATAEPSNPSESAYVPSTKEEKKLSDLANRYPDSLILQEDLIQYYRENGNYDMAIKVADRTIEKHNHIARLYNIRGTLAYEDDDTTTAIKSFEKAVSILPDPEYVVSLAILYARTKNPKSITLADRIIKTTKASEDEKAYFIKGLYYSSAGDKKKSIDYFDKALNLSYTFMDAYREKALSLYAMGKYNDALSVMDKALTINNTWDEGYYYSGMILEKMNRRYDAILSYQNALKLSPDYSEARDALTRLGVHS